MLMKRLKDVNQNLDLMIVDQKNIDTLEFAPVTHRVKVQDMTLESMYKLESALEKEQKQLN